MNREKIKLVTNVPLVIDLEDLGTETRTKFPEPEGSVEYRYNVMAGDTTPRPSMIYLPVDGHLAVKRSGAIIGDRIEITKTLFQNRPRFEVRRFSDAQLAVEAPHRPAAPPQQAAAPPQQAVTAPREIRMVAPTPRFSAMVAPTPRFSATVAPPVRPPVAQAAPQRQTYTNGAAVAQVAPPISQMLPERKPDVHPLQERMTRCLEVAYHAHQTAWLNLRAEGIEIDAPTWEDCRCSATTLFIEIQRGGR
jgi:hypothetical protein